MADDEWVEALATPAPRGRRGGPLWVGLAVAVVAAVLGTVVLLATTYKTYSIPSSAMEPTLAIGSWVLVDTRATSPQDGDIVVFHEPDWTDGRDVTFVKRVLASEGEVISCCRGGAVVRDGEALAEGYLAAGDAADDPLSRFGPETVPAGRLWVMGDNRGFSADSRVHALDDGNGTISVEGVVGTVVDRGSRAEVYARVVRWPVITGVLLGAVTALVLRRRRRA